MYLPIVGIILDICSYLICRYLSVFCIEFSLFDLLLLLFIYLCELRLTVGHCFVFDIGKKKKGRKMPCISRRGAFFYWLFVFTTAYFLPFSAIAEYVPMF